jgi:hypothetical protein
MKIAAQILAYTMFISLIGVFTSQPELRFLESDEALLSLSFTHAAQRIGECVRLSQEELLALPPNMRSPDMCPRERHPMRIEIIVDGETLLQNTLAPSGLWHDGKASVYQRFRIKSGDHKVTVRMNDSGDMDGFDFERTVKLQVTAGQNIVVFFDPDKQRFAFQ